MRENTDTFYAMHKMTGFWNSGFILNSESSASTSPLHYVKHQSFNFAFPQNFHSWKLGKITVFYVAEIFKNILRFDKLRDRKYLKSLGA